MQNSDSTSKVVDADEKVESSPKPSKKSAVALSDRAAFSPTEFASLFGKGAVWGYRQLYAGRVKAIQTLGHTMIPRTEVDRILASATEYQGEISR